MATKAETDAQAAEAFAQALMSDQHHYGRQKEGRPQSTNVIRLGAGQSANDPLNNAMLSIGRAAWNTFGPDPNTRAFRDWKVAVQRELDAQDRKKAGAANVAAMRATSTVQMVFPTSQPGSVLYPDAAHDTTLYASADSPWSAAKPTPSKYDGGYAATSQADVFVRHLQTGEQSSNIEDRRNWAPTVSRSFEFDGRTVLLNVANPDGSIMSDEQAVAKFKKDGETLNPPGQYSVQQPLTRAANANLNPQQIQTLTYTLLGEAGGEGVPGMIGVANVINNRSLSGAYPSDPVDVALQPSQFSTWNDAKNGGHQKYMQAAYPVGSDQYRVAEAIVRQTFIDGTMPDNTGGAWFYHANGITPSWASAVTGDYGAVQIGNQTFYPRHPIPPMNIPDVGTLLDTQKMEPVGKPISWGDFNRDLGIPLPTPAPLTAPPVGSFGGRLPSDAMFRQDRLAPGQITYAPQTGWVTDVSRETFSPWATDFAGAGIDSELYAMAAPQTPALDPIGAGTGSWGDFTKQFAVPLPTPAPLVGVPVPPAQVAAPVPRPRPLPSQPAVPLPRARPNVTAEGLAILPVQTVPIGPDGNPIVNAPKPVPVAGKPVDDRQDAIQYHRENLPATVRVQQVGGTLKTTGQAPAAQTGPGPAITLPASGLPSHDKIMQQVEDAAAVQRPVSTIKVDPKTKAVMNDTSSIANQVIHPVKPAAETWAPYPQARLPQGTGLGFDPAPVPRQRPGTPTVTTKTTTTTEWIENPAYRKWLETYGNGGANVSGSPDDRDAAHAAAAPPPPPTTIAVTRPKTTTVRTVAEPAKAPPPTVILNSRGQQVVKVQTTRYDADLNDWVPVEKYVPVAKAPKGTLPEGSGVAAKPVSKPNNGNGGGGGGGGSSGGSSGSSVQYVRKSDGTPLKPVAAVRYNNDTGDWENYTRYVPA